MAGKGLGRRVQHGFADSRSGAIGLFHDNLFTLLCHQQGGWDGAMKAQTGTVRLFPYDNAIYWCRPAAVKDYFSLNRLTLCEHARAAQADACFRDVPDGTGERRSGKAVICFLDEDGTWRFIKLHSIMLAVSLGSFLIGIVCGDRPAAMKLD